MSINADPDLEVIIQQTQALIRQLNVFLVLFGHSQTRFHALAHRMPTIMVTFKEALWTDIVIGICRITDPVKSSGKDNLVLARLVDDPRASKHAKAMKTRLDKLVGRPRDHRNRLLAHLDLKAGHDASIIKRYRRKTVERIVKTIATLVEYLHRDFYNAATSFCNIDGADFQCRWLLSCLELGEQDIKSTHKRAMELK